MVVLVQSTVNLASLGVSDVTLTFCSAVGALLLMVIDLFTCPNPG